VDFVLPSGSFATAVTREILKSPEPMPTEA